MVAGCETPAPSVQLFSSTGRSAATLVPPATTTQLGRRELRLVVDDIDAAEYRLPPSARLYLLRGDVNAGIDALDSPIAAYRLPATTDPEALRRVALTRDKEWGSLRVEDFGHCSLFLSWSAIATAFNQILVAEVDALEETAGSVSLRSAGRRSNIGPILGRQSTTEADDTIRYSGTLEVDRIALCGDVVLDYAARLRLISRSPSPGVFDHSMRVDAVQSNVRGVCVGEEEITSRVREAFRTALPPAFGEVVTMLTEFLPDEFDQNAQVCSFDEGSCVDPLRGPRSTCVAPPNTFTQCNVRLEVDRLFVTPEGIQVVYAETEDDPQLALIERAGDPIFERLGVDRETAAALGLAHFGCEPDPGRLPITAAESMDERDYRVTISQVVDAGGLR